MNFDVSMCVRSQHTLWMCKFRMCVSERDPLSTLSTVKYELLRWYETCSLWLNLQWGPPLPPPPPIRIAHIMQPERCTEPGSFINILPCLRPVLTAPSSLLSFVRGCGCKCVHQAWLCTWAPRVIDPPSQGCTPILTGGVIVIVIAHSFSLPLSWLHYLIWLLSEPGCADMLETAV